MSTAWRSYPGAPDPGTELAALEDVPQGFSSFVVSELPVLVVRRGDDLTGFVNACPHQFLPLDHRGRGVLSADGERLICSNHDAVFDAATGAGLGGHGQGCWLDPVPLRVKDGRVVLGN